MLPLPTLISLLPLLLCAHAAPLGYGSWYQPDVPQPSALPPTPEGGWPKNPDGTDNLPTSWSETYDPSTGAMVVDVVYGADVVVVGDGGYQTGPAAPGATGVSGDPNAASFNADPGYDTSDAGAGDNTDYSADDAAPSDGTDYGSVTDYYTPAATDAAWRRQDPTPTDAAWDPSADTPSDPSSWDAAPSDWTDPGATDPSYDAPTPTAWLGDASTADLSQQGVPGAADAIRQWMSALRWPFQQQPPAPTPTTLILAPPGWGEGTTVSLKWRGMPTAVVAKRDWVQDDSGNWVWVDPTPTAATAAPTEPPAVADPWVRPVPWRDQPAEYTVDGIVHYDYTGTGLCNWGLGQNGDLLNAYIQWMNTHTFAPGETIPPMRRRGAVATPAPTPGARFSRPPYHGGPVHAISDLAAAPTATPAPNAAGVHARAEADAAAYVGDPEPPLTAAAAETHASATNAEESTSSVSPATAHSSDEDAPAVSPLLDDAQEASFLHNHALAALSRPKFSFFALGASTPPSPDAPVASDSPHLSTLSSRDDTSDSVAPPEDPATSAPDSPTVPPDSPVPDTPVSVSEAPAPDTATYDPWPDTSSPPEEPSPSWSSDTPSPWDAPADATIAVTDYYAEPTDTSSQPAEPVAPAPTPVATTLPPLFPTGIFATATLPTYDGPPLWTGDAITRPPAPGPDPCGAAAMQHFKRWTRDDGHFPAATGWMTQLFPGDGQCFGPTTTEDHNMGHAVTAMEMVMDLKMTKLPAWMQTLAIPHASAR
ncbi:uncharacterized protein LOC62_04G005952 [Vanrija pseudolonga]|uniref:Uncharacterized protein n=1 Tax=Vanrija pseudolonga TaxID=143232 RepID=A0AAF0YES2_9TREE|nr:hypothetical protein LOC62_04G005952 [Vanrija pseudolonga]